MPKAAPPEDRQNAIRLASEIGVSAAAKQTGYSKGAISKWLSEAGMETVHSERTRAAVATHKLNADERKARLADRLLEIAEHGVERELELLGSADLRDVVGARTRAIHDAQLLSGAATSRFGSDAERKAVIEQAKERALRLVG